MSVIRPPTHDTGPPPSRCVVARPHAAPPPPARRSWASRYLVRRLAPPTTDEALRYNRAADFLVTVYEAWTKKPEGGREILVTKVCDQQPGQTGSTLDGVVRRQVVPAGNYITVESFGPAGYRPVGDFTIALPSGQTTQLNVTNDRS